MQYWESAISPPLLDKGVVGGVSAAGSLVHCQPPGASEAAVVEPEVVQLPRPGTAPLAAHPVLIQEMSLEFPVAQPGTHESSSPENPGSSRAPCKIPS